MPDAHAKLSPSSSERWINCPASIRMTEEYALPGDDEGSVYALEGTLAHTLGELEAGLAFGLITKRKYNAGIKKWAADVEANGFDAGEMRVHVNGYVALLKERMTRYPGSVLKLEQRLDSGIPGCWGTSDAVIFSPQHVEIIDLKYGAGVPVSAVGNSQLRAYGLGALDTYGDVLDTTETIRMTVFQPRVNNTDHEDMHPDELRAWRENVATPAALETREPDARFGPSEKACRWCPVKGICKVRMQAGCEEDFGDMLAEDFQPAKPAEVLTPEELSLVLKRIPEIKAWAAAVEAHALEMTYSHGGTIPGFKVVRSGGKRSIADQAHAVQTLIDAGYKPEEVADFKTKGIGHLERLLGKDGFQELLGEFIVKSQGKESLVPEDDKRPAISPTAEAAEDFAEVPAA